MSTHPMALKFSVAAAAGVALAAATFQGCKTRTDTASVKDATGIYETDDGWLSSCVESRQFSLADLAGGAAAAKGAGLGLDDPRQAIGAQAYNIFKSHCTECHSAFAAAGKMGNITDYNTAVTMKAVIDGRLGDAVDPGTASMPPLTRPDKRLSLDEIKILRAWAASDTPPLFPGQTAGAALLPSSGAIIGYVDQDDQFDNSVAFISKLSQFACARQDYLRQPKNERKFVRYVSLTHLYNAGLKSNWRQKKTALYKALNSVSRNSVVINPIPIDQGTQSIFRINLKAYGFDDAAHLKLWDQTAALDPYKGGDALVVDGTDIRPVRADWFVNQITKSPTYYQFTDAPASLNEFYAKHQVDIVTQRNNQSVRRGVFRSALTGNNKRVVEMVRDSSTGLFWQSFDFENIAGDLERSADRDPVANPFGPCFDGAEAPFSPCQGLNSAADLITARVFKPKNVEVAYSLKNGFYAYVSYVGGDSDANFALSEINPVVADADDTQHQNRAGASCIGCHATGPMAFNDVLGNEGRRISSRVDIPKNSLFTAEQAQALSTLYPKTLDVNEYVNFTIQRFADASKGAGVLPDQILQEPVKALNALFNTPVTPVEAAAEFGLKAQDFQAKIGQSSDATAAFAALLSGQLARDEFQARFSTLTQFFQPTVVNASAAGTTGATPGQGGAGAGPTGLSCEAQAAKARPKNSKSGITYGSFIGTLDSCQRAVAASANDLVCGGLDDDAFQIFRVKENGIVGSDLNSGAGAIFKTVDACNDVVQKAARGFVCMPSGTTTVPVAIATGKVLDGQTFPSTAECFQAIEIDPNFGKKP